MARAQDFRWQAWTLAVCVAAAIAAWPGSATTTHPSNVANLNFTLKDMHGADVRLADYRGRPILLNFWATWCGPCRLEIPAFVALADQYRSQNLTVLGVSVDDTPDQLRPFVAEYHMNYPVLIGQGHDALQEAYDAAMAIPVTWFIRADGTVQTAHKGPATRAWFEAEVKALVTSAPRVTP